MGKINLIILMMFLLLPAVNAFVYYDVNVEYSSGELSIVSSDIVYDRFERTNVYFEDSDEPRYLVQFEDENGEVIYSEWVNVPVSGIEHYGDDETGLINDSKLIVRDNFVISFKFPYREDVNSLVFYDSESNVVTSVDTRTYAKERSEKPLEPSDLAVSNESGSFVWFVVLILILLLVAISVYVYFKYFAGGKKRKKQ